MHGIAASPTRRVNAVWPRCNKGVTIALALAAFTGSTSAAAVEIDGSATLASDYRFRGLSLSDGHPVVEASVEASLAAGWFAGAEVVSASSIRSAVRLPRRDAEVDLSAGWSRSLGLLTPAAGVIGYLHPGGGEALDGEVFGTLEGALGPATLTVGANYAPDQSVVPGGNFYVFTRARVGIPATPISLKASVGREAGAFARGSKIDYSIGADIHVGFVTVGIAYVGNDLAADAAPFDRRARRNGVVGTVTARF